MIKEFSYLAGYLDGDGCFYMGTTNQKPKNILIFEYNIQIVSVEMPNLENFLKHGGFIRKKHRRVNHKTPYFFCMKKCKDFIYNIYPYLIDKKEQAFYMIELIKSIESSNYQSPSEQVINHRFFLIHKNREEKMSQFITKEKIDFIKNIKPSIKPSESDFAYLSGFIEAEGTFRIKKWKPKNKPNYVYNISLEIGNTRFPIFSWLMDRFGGNISFIPPKKTKRAAAIWSLQSDSLADILPILYNHLRTRKKHVCEQLIEFTKTVLPNGGDRHSAEFKIRMDAVIQKREQIVETVHQLNKKGE